MSSENILFTPLSIGKVSIKNRFAMAPMGPLGLGDEQGGFNQRGIDYYTARARGGNLPARRPPKSGSITNTASPRSAAAMSPAVPA